MILIHNELDEESNKAYRRTSMSERGKQAQAVKKNTMRVRARKTKS